MGGARRESARRTSRGYRRSCRVVEDAGRPTRDARRKIDSRVFFSFPVALESRERARASPSGTAPAGKNTRARVPHLVRNTPPPVSGARCRTPRTGATSDGATRVYFCCESGHRTLYRGRRCRCSSRRRLWRCCTACKASLRPSGASRDDADPSRCRTHASPCPRSSRPDATRRLFLRHLPRKNRRCLLRSAMDRPRKRALLPTPTRPFANFASPRVLLPTPGVPKRASPSPAPRAAAHAAPSGVADADKKASRTGLSRAGAAKTCLQEGFDARDESNFSRLFVTATINRVIKKCKVNPKGGTVCAFSQISVLVIYLL